MELQSSTTNLEDANDQLALPGLSNTVSFGTIAVQVFLNTLNQEFQDIKLLNLKLNFYEMLYCTVYCTVDKI